MTSATVRSLALLWPSFVLALGLASAREVSAQSCDLPGQYTHSATGMVDIIQVTVATEASTYLIGDPIACYLEFENVGDSTYVIPNPGLIDPMRAFHIFPDTCQSLDQEGCTEKTVFWNPSGVFFFGVPITLQPGQCLTYEVTWDGDPFPAEVTAPGNYVLAAGMNAGGRELFFPPGGVRLPLTLDTQATVPVIPTHWGRIKSMYGP